MTNQEIHMSPFKIAMLKTGMLLKKHTLTFLIGAASGVGITLGTQYVMDKMEETATQEQEMGVTIQ